MASHFFLSREAEGLGLMGGEDGVAIWGALVYCVASVAAASMLQQRETPLFFMERTWETSTMGS